MSNSNTTVTPTPVVEPAATTSAAVPTYNDAAPARIENAHIESGNLAVVLYGATTELVRGVARYCRVFSRTAEVADNKVASWQDNQSTNAIAKQELAVTKAALGQKAIRDQIEVLRNQM